MESKERITVVIPAYNEEQTIGDVIEQAKQAVGSGAEILVVDDGSTDGTQKLAEGAGARVVSHPYNKGNGAAVKTGIRSATGEIVVLMDGDGQHDPSDIPRLVEKMDVYDMVVGSRGGRSSGPLHRRMANWIYNDFASYLTQQKVSDLTSGFRAIRKSIIMKFLYLLPNTFSYPSTCTMTFLKAGYSIGYVPIAASKRRGKSKINLISDGVRFFLILFKVATLFSPFRVFFPTSALIFFMGVAYSFETIVFRRHFTNMGLLFLVTGIIIFFMGLIAEQIALLRMERSEEA